MLKVAIGPMPFSGGVRSHIINIIRFSKNYVRPIKIPIYSIYHPIFRGFRSFLITHPDIPIHDPYGFYLSKFILPKYDIIHTHGHPSWRDIYKKPNKTKAKYIHTVHQFYFEDEFTERKEWKLFDMLNKLLIRYCQQADVVITVSKWLQEILETNYNIKSTFIRNGVDFELAQKAQPFTFKKKLNLNEDFYLFIGHLGNVKRPKLFIELAKLIPDKLFVMAGYGINYQNLKNLTGDIPKNIICLGELKHREVFDAISSCRVLIVPSIREASPLIVLEALACGKTVVATNSTGIREIYDNTPFLILFEKNNIHDLYEKACFAWDHPEIGLKAYEKAKEKYSWRRTIGEIDKLYESIVQ